MAAGDTKSFAKGLPQSSDQGITLTGLSNNTGYVAKVTFPTGRIQTIAFTTNGSGQFVLPGIPAYEPGTYNLSVESVPAVVYTTSWRA